jgi:hypothetical protein
MAGELTPSSPPARTPRRQRPTPVPSRRRGRPPRWTAARPLAAALVILAVGGAGLAWSDDAVNVTFHVGAQGQTIPCFPAELVNLNAASVSSRTRSRWPPPSVTSASDRGRTCPTGEPRNP